MDGGEITREDLKTELLTNWDGNVLQSVGKRCGVEIPADLSKEEAVDRLLDDAPLEKLLEQLLQWELTGGDAEDDEGGEAETAAAAEAASIIAEDRGAGAEGADDAADEGAEASGEADADAAEDSMPEGPDPDDPTLSRVEQEALSQAADALSMLDEEIKSTIQPADTSLEPAPGDDMGPEDVPREALEAELQANWAADEVRALAGHFQIEVDGRGKDELVGALLDEVSRTVLIQEMLAREGGGAPDSAPSAVPSAVPVPVPQAEPEPEPDPEPEAEAEAEDEDEPEKPPEKVAKPAPSYDDSSLLRELRSMRRETDYQDDEFEVGEDDEGSPLLKMGLVAAVIVGGLFVMTPGPTPPRPPASPSAAPTAVAVAPTGVTTGTSSPDGVAAGEGTTTTAAVDGSAGTTQAAEAPTASASPVPSLTPTATPEGTPAATPGATTPAATPGATTPAGTTPAATTPATPAPPAATTPAGPPDALALQQQAVSAKENGDLGRAIFNGIRALERGGADWSAREDLQKLVSESSYSLGERAFREGETDKALVELRRAIEYGPDNADAHFTLGRCYERLKEYGLAIEAYSEAVRARPDYGRAHSYLAYAYRAKKMYTEAERHAGLAEKYGEDLDPGFLFLLRYRPTPKPER